MISDHPRSQATPAKPLSIGLLVCDQVAPELQPNHGSYDSMLRNLIALSGLNERPAGFTMTTYNLHLGEVPQRIEDHDVYLTSGSKFSVNDSEDWISTFERLTLEAVQKNIIYIGICFGHQMLAKALGGKVELAEQGWGIGCTDYQIESIDPLVANIPEPPMDRISICISHKEQVVQLPERAQVIGGNPFCPTALVLFEKNALGIQGHPEFSLEYCRDLMNLRQSLYPKEVYEAGLQSLYEGIDPILWAKWLAEFITARS